MLEDYEKDRSTWHLMPLRVDFGFDKRLTEEEEIGLPSFLYLTALQPRKKGKTCFTVTHPFSLIPYINFSDDLQRILNYAETIGTQTIGVIYGYEFDSQSQLLYSEVNRYVPVTIQFKNNAITFSNKPFQIGSEKQLFPSIVHFVSDEIDPNNGDDSEIEDLEPDESEIEDLEPDDEDEKK